MPEDTSYMIDSYGDIRVFHPLVFKEGRGNGFRMATPDEVRAFREDGRSNFAQGGCPESASSFHVQPVAVKPSEPAETAEAAEPLVLSDGTDITRMSGRDMRDYAARCFDPAPSFPASMKVDEIRAELVRLDAESAE